MFISLTHKTPLVSPQLASTSYWTKYSHTLHKVCVMVLDHMIQEHNLGETFHRSIVSQPQARNISREFTSGNIWHCVWRVQWTICETTIMHPLCTGDNESLRLPLLFFSQLKVWNGIRITHQVCILPKQLQIHNPCSCHRYRRIPSHYAHIRLNILPFHHNLRCPRQAGRDSRILVGMNRWMPIILNNYVLCVVSVFVLIDESGCLSPLLTTIF